MMYTVNNTMVEIDRTENLDEAIARAKEEWQWSISDCSVEDLRDDWRVWVADENNKTVFEMKKEA